MEKKIKIVLIQFIINTLLVIRTLFLIPHGVCRFTPSCSKYAETALHTLPLHRAIIKIIWRIIKCNPFTKGGFDPVQ